MAKKRSGRKPEDWKAKPIVLQVRGSEEYKAVIERLSEHVGLSLAAMADQAIRFYAREVKFAEAIPKR